MRALLALLALARPACGWAPLDRIASLLGGSPPLHARETRDADARPRPLADVEHVPCSLGARGCEPEGGCRRAGRQCEPLVGHYWFGAPPAPPAGLLASVLPPAAPPFTMMTSRGPLRATAGWWYTTYALQDEPDAASATLPGLRIGGAAACAVTPLLALWLLRVWASRPRERPKAR